MSTGLKERKKEKKKERKKERNLGILLEEKKRNEKEIKDKIAT